MVAPGEVRDTSVASRSWLSGETGAYDMPQFPTTSVVTPCIRVLSESRLASSDQSEWEWQSMKPGATYFPVASIAVLACASRRPPTAAMRPSWMATSARVHGAPLPSITRALRINVSSTREVCGLGDSGVEWGHVANLGQRAFTAIGPVISIGAKGARHDGKHYATPHRHSGTAG